MSNIIKKQGDLEKTNLIDLMYKLEKNITKDDVLQTMNVLLSLANVNYDVAIRGSSCAAKFIPQYQEIIINISKLEQWLAINSDEDTRKYMLIFAFAHEIEHSIQYDIAYDIKKTDIEMLKQAYHGIYELFKRDNSILPHPIKDTRRRLSLFLYKINENNYVLERNANIEAFDLILSLALLDKNEKQAIKFRQYIDILKHLGYIENNNGCIKQTYEKILMKDKYAKMNNIPLPLEDRIRYGFQIDEEEKKLVFFNNKL